MSNRKKLINMLLISLFAAIITVCSWITVPSVVPFTLQTFAVFLAFGVLGGKKGTAAVLLYIALGALGVPVFSGFKGGIGVLLGSTGGYIIGFIFCGFIYALFTKLFGEKAYIKALSSLVGMILCYAFGTVWFFAVYTANVGETGIKTAFLWCVLPFIIPDAAKIVLALFISNKINIKKLNKIK